ncbi:hypothetical protein IMSAGC011_00348 [Lachnospiraceae bacterium]|nr:hypothetical protein IMSAGC011_00348 [Lachnospiraceae bacterium]
MIRFMEICSDILAYGYVFVFLCMICTFFQCPLWSVWGNAGFFVYIFVFQVGKMIEKITVVLFFVRR